jgi:hypothetical protein
MQWRVSYIGSLRGELPMKVLDTRLQSVGAEFLVLGHMLIEGISAHKEYVNRPGHDLIAENAGTGSLARIQVKSRFASDANGFPIGNFDCEFVVYAKLNRGYRYTRRKVQATDLAPALYVLPIAKVKRAINSRAKWGKQYRVYTRDLEPIAEYLNAWHLIREYLTIPPPIRRRK